MTEFKNQEFPEIGEDSTCPVLIHLSKKGYTDTIIKKPNNDGPKRKYYTIVDSGLKELKVFKSKWQVLNEGMINLFEGESDVK